MGGGGGYDSQKGLKVGVESKYLRFPVSNTVLDVNVILRVI